MQSAQSAKSEQRVNEHFLPCLDIVAKCSKAIHDSYRRPAADKRDERVGERAASPVAIPTVLPVAPPIVCSLVLLHTLQAIVASFPGALAFQIPPPNGEAAARDAQCQRAPRSAIPLASTADERCLFLYRIVIPSSTHKTGARKYIHYYAVVAAGPVFVAIDLAMFSQPSSHLGAPVDVCAMRQPDDVPAFISVQLTTQNEAKRHMRHGGLREHRNGVPIPVPERVAFSDWSRWMDERSDVQRVLDEFQANNKHLRNITYFQPLDSYPHPRPNTRTHPGDACFDVSNVRARERRVELHEL